MSLLGVDIGTSSCKAILFDTEGNRLGFASAEYPEIYPKAGWVEMNPIQVWKAVRSTIKRCVSQKKVDSPLALGFSVLGEAVTPINSSGQELYNSITSVDRRCLSQTRWWREKLGREKIFAITGMPLHTCYTLNKILWIRDELPEVFENTTKFLLYEDYLIYKLGLDPIIDYSLASRTMAFDILTKEWSSEILAAASLTPDIFAEVRPSGVVVGELGKSMARQLGLPAGVKVVSAGHDQTCCALGAGVLDPGIAVDTTGTSECVTAALYRPILTEEMLSRNHPCYCHVVPDRYVAVGYTHTAGQILRWYRDTLGQDDLRLARTKKVNFYELILEESFQKKTRVFALPHFAGSGTPYLDPLSRGAFIGLDLSTTRGEIVRAIVESLCFELKQNLDSLDECGVQIQELRAIGGGSRSESWLQLKANVTGRRIVSLQEEEAGCLGAAILAGVGADIFKDMKEGVHRMVRKRKTYLPDPTEQERYSSWLDIYREIYPALVKLHHRISQLGTD